MSSYRSSVVSAPRRNSSSSIVVGRPRSLGLGFGLSSTSSSRLSSPSLSPSSFLTLSSLSPSSLSYGGGHKKSSFYPGSSLSLSTYGGTSSGYGGITIAASPRAAYSRPGHAPLSTPRTHPTRSSSFNLHTSSRSSPFTPRSRSGSWVSLASSSRSGSEGYISGSEWSGPSSRLSSPPASESSTTPAPTHAPTSTSNTVPTTSQATAENGEVDYKKLYEQSILENERLREKLKKTEDDLSEARSQLEKPTKNSLSEKEKRERRALERKLSEMEEELKQLQKLKAENERLKAENRALTRVVSKLTLSASNN